MDLQLIESRHPVEPAQLAYDSLVAIDAQKNALLSMLSFFFDKGRLESWHKKHHQSKLVFLNNVVTGTPLIILEGDVGCGKTALANCIATPLGKLLEKRVFCFETPSNIRGGGKVGEISNRITEAFTQAKSKIKGHDIGIFIIDEADDLATDREQNQAHHEDKAGLNVLIKQIDSIAKEKANLAIILITNRLKALDPAVVRRATQVITFVRPDQVGRKKVFQSLLLGTKTTEKDLDELVTASGKKDRLYSFSDLVQRVGRQALLRAIEEDRSFDKTILLETLSSVEPSPTIK